MDNWKEAIKNIILGIVKAFFALFGGSPRRYWPFFVVAMFIFLIVVFILGGIIFWRTYSSAFHIIYVLPDEGVKAVNRGALEDAIKIFEERENNFADAFSAPPMEDPSL